MIERVEKAVGQQLGNYRLVRLLGKGGFTEVYLGEHIHLNTQAAIKVLYTSLTDEDVESFHNEARTIALLKHPHIVRVLDSNVQGDIPFIVMSYAPNGTLRQRHPGGTRLPFETINSYVQQLADALQYAHDQKIVHRDIKPENMLLGRHHEVLLSDFNLAIVLQSSQLQITREAAGTTTYMAPEQVLGKPRPASDQYALGVVVYEWLTGHPPFRGSLDEVTTQHLFALPASLREKVPAIPPEVEEVVLTTLQKDPRHRFASVRAFAHAFQQATTARRIFQVALPAGTPVESITTQVLTPHSDAHELLASTQPVPNSGRFTRRTVLIGLAALAVASSGGAVAWSALTHKTLTIYRGHTAEVSSVAWSPNSKYAASGSLDRTVQVWNPVTGHPTFVYRGHASAVYTVAWSPDGTRIASAGADHQVHLWNTFTGTHILAYHGHTASVNAVAWSPDGKYILSAGADHQVHLWDSTTSHLIFMYDGHTASVNAVAWSPDGKYILSTDSDHQVHLWTATGHLVLIYRGHPDQVFAGAWSPDGKRIASGSGGREKVVQIWTTRGNHLLTYENHSSSTKPIALAWSPDSSRIVSTLDTEVHVWNATTRATTIIYRDHLGTVKSVSWSPDGSRIASGSDDSTIQIWRAT
jgi:eukaryotic-like serine/threonine-protein kinase